MQLVNKETKGQSSHTVIAGVTKHRCNLSVIISDGEIQGNETGSEERGSKVFFMSSVAKLCDCFSPIKSHMPRGSYSIMWGE